MEYYAYFASQSSIAEIRSSVAKLQQQVVSHKNLLLLSGRTFSSPDLDMGTMHDRVDSARDREQMALNIWLPGRSQKWTGSIVVVTRGIEDSEFQRRAKPRTDGGNQILPRVASAEDSASRHFLAPADAIDESEWGAH